MQELTVAHFDGCLDLFRGVPTNIMVESGRIVEFSPLGFSPDTSSGGLLFDVNPTENLFIDLNATQLRLSLKIVKGDGTDRKEDHPNTDLLGPVNAFMSSIFSQVDVSLNGTPVTSSNPFYPYKVMIETLLMHPMNVKKYQLERSGYFPDSLGNIDDLPTWNAEAAKQLCNNAGLLKRMEPFLENKTAEFIGKIHASIFQTERLLIPGVGIRMALTTASPQFCLMAKAGSSYKVKIMEAALCVRYVKVIPTVLSRIEEILQSNNALYPLQHSYIKAYNIPAGSMSDIRDNLVTGGLPELMIICMVQNSRCAGTWTQSPFKFEPFNISAINVLLDSLSIPGKPLQFDSDSRYINAYDRLFSQLGLGERQSNGIRLEDFKSGQFFLCYNLKPDGTDCSISALSRQGTIRVELNFHEALANTVTVLCYLQYSKLLQITSRRDVIYDIQQ